MMPFLLKTCLECFLRNYLRAGLEVKLANQFYYLIDRLSFHLRELKTEFLNSTPSIHKKPFRMIYALKNFFFIHLQKELDLSHGYHQRNLSWESETRIVISQSQFTLIHLQRPSPREPAGSVIQGLSPCLTIRKSIPESS